jgi:SAM-dependent methyltransferase
MHLAMPFIFYERLMENSWFQYWFGEAYKQLYPHRNISEARTQVEYLLRELPVTPAWRILDIGCGQGRHLEILRSLGYPSCLGLDLSLPLLSDARKLKLAVTRSDMRYLPFRSESFDLVTSFFTSFGYFATLAEDANAMSQFGSVLKPGGNLFMDLINKNYLLRTLVPENRQTINGGEVLQRRRLEGQVVIKEIEIFAPDGSVEKFTERVRLYSLEEILELAERFSLRHRKSFGDEMGGRYHNENSPRMTLLLQKVG